MKKIRQYKFDTIEICRNCGGKGVVAIEKNGLFSSLRGTGVTECDAAVVAIGANVESSLLATANCKELGVGTVIAKATSELHGKILEKLGADQVIFPDRESARRLARCITGGEAPSPASEEG